jgi:hypothetical protein
VSTANRYAINVSIEVTATLNCVLEFVGSVQKTDHDIMAIRTRGRITFRM